MDRHRKKRSMTSERKIWEAALMLIRQRGKEGPTYAYAEAEKYFLTRDELTAAVWRWIGKSAEELLRDALHPHEYLN